MLQFEKQKRSTAGAHMCIQQIHAYPSGLLTCSSQRSPNRHNIHVSPSGPPNRYIHLLAVPNRYNAALIGPSTATLYLSSFSQHHCCCRFQLKFQNVSNTISQLRRCPSTASQHDVSVLVLCNGMPTGWDLQSQGFQDGKIHWT